MKQFYLTEITTKDKLVHQGIFYKPTNPTRTALLLIHGLTSSFYAGIPIFDVLVEYCEKQGIGFAAFNNRGHDFLAGGRRIDRRKSKGYNYSVMGAGYEDFSKCIYDIDAGISFLINQGFTDIILVGISTGANKVCYYAGKMHNKYLKGVVLISPISDRLVPGFDPLKRKADLQLMRGLINQGKGDELLVGRHFFPLTPLRYISLFSPGSEEDTFDYGDSNPKLKYFYKIKKPLLVIFGSVDESRDRPMNIIKKVFDSRTGSLSYTSVIIKDASHNFVGKEKELVDTIFKWYQTL